jgi:hypothetical protein
MALDRNFGEAAARREQVLFEQPLELIIEGDR